MTFFFYKKINSFHSNAKIVIVQSKWWCIETFSTHLLKSVQMIKIARCKLKIHVELSKHSRALTIQILTTRQRSFAYDRIPVIIRDPQSLIVSNFGKKYLQLFAQKIGYKLSPKWPIVPHWQDLWEVERIMNYLWIESFPSNSTNIQGANLKQIKEYKTQKIKHNKENNKTPMKASELKPSVVRVVQTPCCHGGFRGHVRNLCLILIGRENM